jgi:ABC-type branched-subunit amino acid transport system substrate-binding protein
VPVAAVVAAALALASVATVGTAGARARSQTAPKVLKIASLGFQTFYTDLAKGAGARFADANKNKELPGGRTVDYVGLVDDKATADGTVAALRQLKEQIGVWGVAGAVSTYVTPDYVNQNKLPVIGWGTNDAYCTHGAKQTWYLFGITGCLNAADQIYGNAAWSASLVDLAGGTKGVTVACISEDNDSGKHGVVTVCNGAKAIGLKVSFEDATVPPAPIVVSDYSPWVQKIMTANNGKPVDMLLLLPSVANVIGLSTALRQAGYQGINSNPTGYSPALLVPLAGTVAYTQWATGESATQANNSEMAKILTSFGNAGVPADKVGLVALAGWFAADMFVKIAKKVGKNLTPEAFAKAAAKFTYEITDTIGPTTYPYAFAAPTPCAQEIKSDGTKFTIVTTYSCYDNVDIKTGKLIPYNKVNANKKY